MWTSLDLRTHLLASSRAARRARRWLLRIPALGLALGAMACGGNSDAMKKEVSELREQVTQLQGSQDHLEERLMAIEAQRHEKAVAAEVAAEPEADERPRLKTVRLVPEAPAPPVDESGFGGQADASAVGQTEGQR
ncbi:MAG: hypothetical protein KC766_26890 [Myxococcales bacterium]|nr:hypothetical protein [Myxococcales bacterium]